MFVRMFLGGEPRDESAGQDVGHLALRESVPDFDIAVLGHVADGEDVIGTQGIPQILEPEGVVLLDGVVIRRIDEFHCQHTEVREILPVDAGERLRDHHPEAQVARRDRRVFA